ncbi:hypothetical protein GCM10009589_39920 [Arthrobacter pascens]
MLSTRPSRVWTATGSWRGSTAAEALLLAGTAAAGAVKEGLAGMAGEGMESLWWWIAA